MTELVITVLVMQANDTHPVRSIISLWPSRSAVLHDAQKVAPDLDLVAVHRWWQRGVIPSRYWQALLIGASARGIAIDAAAFTDAHAAPSSDAA
jgi:hypothetical protein